MTVGEWDPEGKSASRNVDVALLRQFVQVAEGLQESVDGDKLEAAGLAGESWVMTAGTTAWEAASSFDSGTIVSLIRLFTLVEEEVSGWDAGKKSPVIPLVQLLKARDEFEPELRKWIKRHSKNRYLPYGSAL